MTLSKEVLQHELVEQLLHPLLGPQLVFLAPEEKRRAGGKRRHGMRVLAEGA